MSGPKSFSVKLFRSELEKIFRLQARIESAMRELEKFRITDRERGIDLSTHSAAEQRKAQAKELLKAFSLGNQQGVVVAHNKSDVDSQLTAKLSQLQSFVSSAEGEMTAAQSDYDAYLSYENFHKQAQRSIEKFKSDVKTHFSQSLGNTHSGALSTAQQRVDAVVFKLDQVGFSDDFRTKATEEKKRIETYIDNLEKQVNQVRSDLSASVLTELSADGVISMTLDLTRLPNFKKNDDEVQTALTTLNEFITQIDDLAVKQTYQNRLHSLVQSETLRDVYFYKELYDDLQSAERSRLWKEEIAKAMSGLSSAAIHSSFAKEKEKLENLAVSLVGTQSLKQRDIEQFHAEKQLFETANRAAVDELATKEKQAEFIKQTLIETLQKQGYEVMDDMTVIDFETQSDFVLQIPNQENFLNLRFKEDGSFNYNFLIEEKKEELSVDATKQKLVEMEDACTDFKEATEVLENYGIKLSVEKALGVSEKALMQVPEKHVSKVKSAKKTRQSKKTEQKKQMRMKK